MRTAKPLKLPPDSRWTVLGTPQPRRFGNQSVPYVLAQCSCGSQPRLVAVHRLRLGVSRSCGCQAKANHRAWCTQWKKLSKRPQLGANPQ